MEKTTKKHVDRQATFDTDPHRANLTHGKLKLPIIEAQELEKRKSALKDHRNSQTKQLEDTNVKESVNNVNKTGASVKEIKTTTAAVKGNEIDKKANILLNTNKKAVNGADKEVKSSKDPWIKSPSDSNKTPRKPNGVTNNDKGGKAHAEQKSNISVKPGDSNSKSAILNKVNETKLATGNLKSENSQKTNNSDQKQKPQSNATKNVKDSTVESKSKATENRSRSPEKQPPKAAVLKDLNSKRSKSPEKGRNVSPYKESKLNHTNENSKSKTQNSKTVITKSPPGKPQTVDDKKQNISPRKDNENKSKIVENKSPTIKTDNQKQKHQDNTKEKVKDTKSTTINAIPTNNPPVETHLLNGDNIAKKSVKISPRTKPQTGKSSPSSDLNTDYNESKQILNEDTNYYPKRTVDDSQNSKNKIKGDTLHLSTPIKENNFSAHDSEQHNERKPVTVTADNQTVEKLTHSPGKVQSSGVSNKNETYVLSPSPTKFDSRSTRNNKVSRPARLSPSNESVEPIKLEHRPSPDKVGMDLDRKESYAQVYAERNTLLNAEYTYRKRIKQLEEEANGFLKAIDDLTTENKYLRNRVDTLEDELRNKGNFDTVDKISELEKNKVDLENKIKQLEKSAKSNDKTDELRDLKEQIVKLQSENQAINEENIKLKSENYENTKKLHALEAEKKSLETSVTDVESQKLDKIQDLNKEQKQMNKQLNDLKSKNKSLEKKVDTLEYENKTLSETLNQKKTELNEILGVMKDENKFENEIRDLKSEVLKLNKEKKESEAINTKEKRVLSEKLKDSKSSLDTKSKFVDELKIKLDQVESENKRMKSELDPMKKLVESQKKEIARLKEENERLKKELKENKDMYSRLGNETESASKELKEAKEQLEVFNKDLQKIVNDKESQISKLINQLDTMRQEKENEKQIAKEEKERLASEIDKVESYQETTKRLEIDLKKLHEKVDESKLKEKQLSMQLEDKTFEVSNLEQQVFEMNMKMENHSKRMAELDREKRDMEKEKREWEVKKDKLNDIEASNKRLLEENKRLRNQIEMSSYSSTYRTTGTEEKPLVEAWVNDKIHTQTINHAIYVTKEKERDHRRKKVHLAQPAISKKRTPFSKSSPAKVSRQHKQDDHRSSHPSTHRSLEDLRKVADIKSPESEHSLPELKQDARLTVGYGSFGGYREIHKDRIRAAQKRVY